MGLGKKLPVFCFTGVYWVLKNYFFFGFRLVIFVWILCICSSVVMGNIVPIICAAAIHYMVAKI